MESFMPTIEVKASDAERMKKLRDAFARVGWFIPAFVSTYLLDKFAEAIEQIGEDFEQDHLEILLKAIHTPQRLAAMTLHRYPQTPVIKDYAETISEAVQAHFIGLDHVAFGGLVPVIEGIGQRFAAERNLPPSGVSKLFRQLMEDCKREAFERNIGRPSEIEVMMDSFSHFTTEHLYVDSRRYPLADKTNRHGVAHGAYSDGDYGRPLNFLKAMSAIDFLTFVSIFRHGGSVLVPEQTAECAQFLQCVRAQAALRSELMSTLGREPAKT